MSHQSSNSEVFIIEGSNAKVLTNTSGSDLIVATLEEDEVLNESPHSVSFGEIRPSATRVSLLVPFAGREYAVSNKHLERDMPARYVDANSLDTGGTPKWPTDLVTFEDVYLASFSWNLQLLLIDILHKKILINECASPTSAMHLVEVLFEVENGKSIGRFTDQHILSQFSFDPGANILIITISLTATHLCLWDRGLGGVEFGVAAMSLDICFRVFENIEDPHLDNFFMEFECGLPIKEHALVHKTMLASLYIIFDPGGVNNSLCTTSKQLLIQLMNDLTTEHFDTTQQYMKTQDAVAALAVVLQEWKVFELRNGYKVKLRAIQGIGYTFSGVIEVVELVARHRLHHGLGDALIYGILLNKYGFVGQVLTKHNMIMRQISNLDRKDYGYSWLIAGAMEIFSGESASKTVYQFFKADNSSFDGCEHVKELAQEPTVIGLAMHTCTEVEFENISSIASSGVNNTAIVIVGKGNIVLVSDEMVPAKLELLRCLCAILPVLVVIEPLNDGLWHNKFWSHIQFLTHLAVPKQL
ncbi:hypothetical protein A4A49_06561 [Nicotiana attenuata]|uniref:Uncharacterized protein n=1 Tax=Nicotiana attenuata TaxID=49451 RepID=A0A314L8T4_NICAT|nr:hypothetical protein A4A49_06561 [Nicotiana attenuata]